MYFAYHTIVSKLMIYEYNLASNRLTGKIVWKKVRTLVAEDAPTQTTMMAASGE